MRQATPIIVWESMEFLKERREICVGALHEMELFESLLGDQFSWIRIVPVISCKLEVNGNHHVA